jgi:hypothetical protein
MEILLDENEMAKRLGVSVSWLQKDRSKTGRKLVPFVKLGQVVRYVPAAVSAALAALQTGGDATPRQKARRAAA